MAALQLFDSSVLIPWLRTRQYDTLVTAAFDTRRFLLSTVVWMELYAGTRSRTDKQDLDRMVIAMASVKRVVTPAPEDFYAAGQMVASDAHHHGQMVLREHANELSIALGAHGRQPRNSRRLIDRIWNDGNVSSAALGAELRSV